MNYLFMNEVIIFTSILFTYQNNLFDKMSDSDFVFDYINWVFFSYHKITLKHGGSYIKSPKSLQNKKKQQLILKIKVMNVLNMMQYLTYKDIANNLYRFTNILPFIAVT